MFLRQRQFLPFTIGAPHLQTLSSSASHNHVLVATDRCVKLLTHSDDSGYALRDVPLLETDDISQDTDADAVEVIGCGMLACPGRDQIVVAYAFEGKTYLLVTATDPNSDSSDMTSLPSEAEASRIRFELVSAPTSILSIKAHSADGRGAFYGVILFRVDSMIAFGCVEEITSDKSQNPQCVRLTNEQFAAYFPEFAGFPHPVLAVTTHWAPSKDHGWIAFGCADGFIRVFHGNISDDSLSGPYEVKDFQMDGPVTSLSIFSDHDSSANSSWRCHLLATCAIGHAMVFEDVYSDEDRSELLAGSDNYDSIFACVTADVDSDGRMELLVGTDHEELLAYKKDSSSAPGSSWHLMAPSDWRMSVFGSVYSLLWRDVNGDGLQELLVASATGIYVLELAAFVTKLEALLKSVLP